MFGLIYDFSGKAANKWFKLCDYLPPEDVPLIVKCGGQLCHAIRDISDGADELICSTAQSNTSFEIHLNRPVRSDKILWRFL